VVFSPACKRTSLVSILALVTIPFRLVPFPRYLQTDINRSEQKTRNWKIATNDSKMTVLLCVKTDRCIQNSVQAISLETSKLGLYSIVSWGDLSYADDLEISYEPVWLDLGMLNAFLTSRSCVITQKVYRFLTSSSVLWWILRAPVLH